ncbi:MAG: hypothetical protein Q8R76_02670 [Candidatus Omnitrophota bacterium]|nr:hypothetical protein [Candidatus Omnitrophota bacterium]
MRKTKKTSGLATCWIARFLLLCGVVFLVSGTTLEAAEFDQFEVTATRASETEKGTSGPAEKPQVIDPHFEFMGSSPISRSGAATQDVPSKQSAVQTLNETRGNTSPGDLRRVKESLVAAIAGSPLSRPREVMGAVASISEFDVHRLMHIAFQAKPPSAEQMSLVKSVGDRLLKGETIIADDTNLVPDATLETAEVFYPFDITEALKFLVEARFSDLDSVIKHSDRQWQVLEFLNEMADYHDAFLDLSNRYHDFLNGRIAPNPQTGMSAMPTF